MERWQAGPAVKANGATIIPIARLIISAVGHGGYVTLSPAAVVVVFGGRSFVWNTDAPIRSLEAWRREIPELSRLMADLITVS